MSADAASNASNTSFDSGLPDIVTAAHIAATAAAARHPDDDWVCHVCGNFNRAMRERCNMNVCGAPLGFPGPYSGALSSAGLVPKTAQAADTLTADSDDTSAGTAATDLSTKTSPDRTSEKSTSTDVAPVAFALTESKAGPLSSLAESLSMDSAVSPPLTSLAAAGPRRFDAAVSALSTPSHRSDAVPCIPAVEEFVFDTAKVADCGRGSDDVVVVSVPTAVLLEAQRAEPTTIDGAPVGGVGALAGESATLPRNSTLPAPPTPLHPSPCTPPVAPLPHDNAEVYMYDKQPMGHQPLPTQSVPVLELPVARAALPALAPTTNGGSLPLHFPSTSTALSMSLPGPSGPREPFGSSGTTLVAPPAHQQHYAIQPQAQPVPLPHPPVTTAQPLVQPAPVLSQCSPLQHQYQHQHQQQLPLHQELQTHYRPMYAQQPPLQQVPPYSFVVAQPSGLVYTLPPSA